MLSPSFIHALIQGLLKFFAASDITLGAGKNRNHEDRYVVAGVDQVTSKSQCIMKGAQAGTTEYREPILGELSMPPGGRDMEGKA